MTTTGVHSKRRPVADDCRLPDPPPRHPDDMTSYNHLAATGNAHHLAWHLGQPETTLVAGEHYLVRRPLPSLSGSHYPDLLIAFNVKPAAYHARNGYVIAEQGKPPDFVLEIASPHSGHRDTGVKRDDYAALGIPEYWRFDETGRHHGVRLAGDRLVAGNYQPIGIVTVADDVLQGYSAALNLHLRWERGQLASYDPATGQHIATFDSERTRAAQERVARQGAEARAEQAEARMRELEAELRRLRNS